MSATHGLINPSQSFPLAVLQRDILERILIAVMGEDNETWVISELAESLHLPDEELYQKIVHLSIVGFYR